MCVLFAVLRVRRVEALPEDASSSAPLADVRPAALPSDLIEGHHAGDDDALDAMLAWLEHARVHRSGPAPSPSTTTPPFVREQRDPRGAPASRPSESPSGRSSRLRLEITVERHRIPVRARRGRSVRARVRAVRAGGWNTYRSWNRRRASRWASADFSRRGREQVLEMLDRAAASGFNTVRTWAYSVGERQPMQTHPGVYHEPSFEGLDWVLYEAGKRGVRLVLVLTDYWEHHGGVSQYLDWAAARRRGGGAFPEVFEASKSAFFSDPDCGRMYKANAKALIERVNAFTGVSYRDDPTIFAWELINEPRCRGCGARLQAWIEEMAKYVKRLDPNHMLSTGEEGFYAGDARGSARVNPEVWASTTGQDFIANHAVPEIDFAVAHLWPDNWGCSAGRLARAASPGVDRRIRATRRAAQTVRAGGVRRDRQERRGGRGRGRGRGGFDSLFGFSSASSRGPHRPLEASARSRRGVLPRRARADRGRREPPGRGGAAGVDVWTWHHRDLFRVAADGRVRRLRERPRVPGDGDAREGTRAKSEGD